jgi:hypothetical protein
VAYYRDINPWTELKGVDIEDDAGHRVASTDPDLRAAPQGDLAAGHRVAKISKITPTREVGLAMSPHPEPWTSLARTPEASVAQSGPRPFGPPVLVGE